MRTILQAVAIVTLLSTPLLAADLVNVTGKIALGGYDPVAFFTDHKPVKGVPNIAAMHQGATYYFASQEHRTLFQRNPAGYLPQYGGYCAYGASRGVLAPAEIDTWQVRDGKLYLNKDADVRKRFDADFAGSVNKANENWPGLVASHGR